jgi:predicted ATP-binding protein involved in virulence
MKSNNIKSFSVYGLFETDDVHIPFDENVKILIGENGLGKTQILNIFYYTLTKNFARLSEFSFNKVELVLGDETLEITKKEVRDYLENSDEHPFTSQIKEIAGIALFERLRNEIAHTPPSRMRTRIETHPVYSRLRRIAPADYIIDIMQRELFDNRHKKRKEKKLSANLSKCFEKISACLLEDVILYFPTYRRVEEDLHNLGYDEEELFSHENTLIQFGMDDVQKRFNQIESTIDKFIKDGFSKFSSELVIQFFKDEETPEDVSNKDYLKNIDENDIEILLSRIGDKISDSKKAKIKEIVLNKEVQSNDNSLNLLLEKLIENYSPQKELDNAVKDFRDICNKYLVNKKVFYDESAIKIYVKSDRNDCEIKLSKLSSGEKQIISMFSKIYLSEEEKRFFVLFDEPELSLSIEWQKQLLPDVFNSEKCDFLMAVTHSPFIFDNELDRYAIGLNEYITPIKVSPKNARKRPKK